jgi:MSHA pilin protein MshC
MKPRVGGFTLVELVTIMVILGILAAVAIPLLDTRAYRSLEFRDKTVAALRYAQKTASSHRRLVCVSFPDTATLALVLDTDGNGTCDTALPLPGASGNQVVSGDPINAVFNPLPTTLNFASDGTSADRTLAIAGADTIIVVGASGHVQ